MTCIIGLAEGGKVYMGGDSIATNGWNRDITAAPKVFRVGEFLLGVCGSIRACNILQYHLSVRTPEEGEDDMRYMVTGFAEAVRSCLKDKGYTRIENNREEVNTFLAGYRGVLYHIDTDLQVFKSARQLSTCGAGEQYALAAMTALAESLLPLERIQRSLEIAAELSALVTPPFHIEVLDP